MSGLGGGGGNQPIIRAPGLRTPAEVAAGPALGSDSGRPLIVHVADSAYNGLPVQEMSLFSWQFGVQYAVGTWQLANIAVPTGQVLDVCGLLFYLFGTDLAGAGLLCRDEWFLSIPPISTSWFNVLINGRVPIDVTMSAAGLTRAGFLWLNRNVLADWLATPVHIIVPEGQSLQVSVTTNAVVNPPGALGALVGCQIWGRWLSRQAWDRLKERG